MVLYRTFHTASEQAQGLTPIVHTVMIPVPFPVPILVPDTASVNATSRLIHIKRLQKQEFVLGCFPRVRLNAAYDFLKIHLFAKSLSQSLDVNDAVDTNLPSGGVFDLHTHRQTSE